MSSRPPATIIHEGWTYRRVGRPGRPRKKPRLVDGVEQWWCPCCERWKEGDDFGKHWRASNGLDSWCLACRREDAAYRRGVQG